MEPIDSLCVSTVDTAINDNSTQGLTEEKRRILWDMVCDCHVDLSDIERESLYFLLLQFSDTFAGPHDMPGRTSKLKHFIEYR